jgi:hypothetical protein
MVLPLSILCGESCLLVSLCAGDKCSTAGSDEDRGRSRRSGVEDRGWSSTSRVLSGWTIERSGDTVSSLHLAQGDEEHMFLGLASKPRSTVSSSLDSKPVALGFLVWASKPAVTICCFEPQNHRNSFLVWASKQSGLRFIGYATKPTEVEDSMGHASRSSSLLRL